MAATQGKVPIFQSAGQAVRFWRENWRLALSVGVAGAAALTAVQIFTAGAAGGNVLIALVVLLLTSIVSAAIFTPILSAALHGPQTALARLPDQTRIIWSSMAVVGFFLAIVFIVAAIPGLIVLGFAFAPFAPEVEAAGQNEAAILEIMSRYAQANIGLILMVFAVYTLIWLLLTSALYLAAPASMDQRRVIAFGSWKWTRGNVLRIFAARLVLLLPALILVGALQLMVGSAFGMDVSNPFSAANVARTNPLGYMILYFSGQVASIALYVALEAGLSAYLYQGLKPADAATAP